MIYKSIRVGKGGKPFVMYKLRTMRKEGGSLSSGDDDPRITKVGKFLRKTKLDELPQFVNWLKGDMNLVGPRPEVPDVVKLMTEEEKYVILSVKPGIFDYAALENMDEGETLRGEEDPHKAYLEKIWPRKKELQIYYVQNRNLWLDIKIILKSLKKLLVR